MKMSEKKSGKEEREEIREKQVMFGIEGQDQSEGQDQGQGQGQGRGQGQGQGQSEGQGQGQRQGQGQSQGWGQSQGRGVCRGVCSVSVPVLIQANRTQAKTCVFSSRLNISPVKIITTATFPTNCDANIIQKEIKKILIDE